MSAHSVAVPIDPAGTRGTTDVHKLAQQQTRECLEHEHRADTPGHDRLVESIDRLVAAVDRLTASQPAVLDPTATVRTVT